jgi:hypothetical protein
VHKVSHNQKHLADEFLARPFGPASPELQRLLMIFRGEAMAGKYVLICTKPFAEWTLARLGRKRGDPVELIEDQVFTSLEDAERAVFRLRWKAHTGYDL